MLVFWGVKDSPNGFMGLRNGVKPSMMASQPTPPNLPPPLRGKALLNPYFWKGYIREGGLVNQP